MKTLITQEIDGYKIITGICDAGGFIDAEATRKKVAVEIIKLDVWKNIESLKSQMFNYATQALQAKNNAKQAKTKAEQAAFFKEFKERNEQMEALQEQLKPLAVELQNEFSRLMVELAEYHGLPQGEELVEDAEADEVAGLMVEATAAMQVVTRDKQKIDDDRGRVFWKKSGHKWNRHDITRLGDKAPAGAIEGRGLAEAQIVEIQTQIDTDRIAGLNKTVKADEKAAVIAGIVTRAGQMKNELEVQGDKDALSKSQAWLAVEKEKVELKYA